MHCFVFCRSPCLMGRAEEGQDEPFFFATLERSTKQKIFVLAWVMAEALTRKRWQGVALIKGQARVYVFTHS